MSQPTFLYVEDDMLSREIMDTILQALGYTEITIFADSRDFTERIEALSPAPDLIFLDVHMEPYDGFEMLRCLRNHSRFTNVTVIALTASVMNEEVAQLKRAGFNGAIGKPLDFDLFPECLQKILAGIELWQIT
jgi:two-component system cell cycle response regulator DivK